jgi:hypothetical protein
VKILNGSTGNEVKNREAEKANREAVKFGRG